MKFNELIKLIEELKVKLGISDGLIFLIALWMVFLSYMLIIIQ